MKKVLCLVFAAAILILCSCEPILEKAEFVRGKTENNVYECGMLDLKFSPGPAWKFGEEEYLLAQSGVDPSSMKDPDAVAEQLNSSQTVYDMTAEDEASGISVAITFDNISLYVGGRDTTEEEYVEKLKLEIGEAFKNYDVKVSDGGSKKISVHDFARLTVNMKIGEAFVDQFYYIKKLDGFIMSVSITAPAGIEIEDTVLDFFS